MHIELEKKTEVLETLLGVSFEDRELVIEALTHPSHINECTEGCTRNNDSLAFLGDSVLQTGVSQLIFEKFHKSHPSKKDLEELRRNYVTHEQLAQIADRLGLRKYILLSVGQSRTISADSKENKHLLVTALKAVFGAIFFEKGIEKLNEVIDRIFKISSLKTPSRFLDPKNDLHVLAQNQYHAIPSYQETNVWGLPHERRFEIAVFIRTTKIGTGVGCSKKEAEKAAAQNALETKSTWEKTLK